MIDPATSRCRSWPTPRGDVIHLYERDCSVQRRHQKVIEIAPAPHLDQATCARDLRRRGRVRAGIGYVNAGTVEFLVDPWPATRLHRDEPAHPGRAHGDRGDHRRRPGAAQLRIAAGETLADLGLAQDGIRIRGAALQCRITTEDPANGFRPDTGAITTYRSPGGAGVRLDGGTTYPGARSAPTSTRCWPSSPAAAGLRGGRRPGPPRAGRVPHPRRRHQHPVPAGRARRPRLPRGRRHHRLHRGAPAAARPPARPPTAAPSCSPTSPT